ncbi:hypothetical protein ACOSQ2_027397 [Xanthoceras sorbifolium]
MEKVAQKAPVPPLGPSSAVSIPDLILLGLDFINKSVPVPCNRVKGSPSHHAKWATTLSFNLFWD